MCKQQYKNNKLLLLLLLLLLLGGLFAFFGSGFASFEGKIVSVREKHFAIQILWHQDLLIRKKPHFR